MYVTQALHSGPVHPSSLHEAMAVHQQFRKVLQPDMILLLSPENKILV